MSQYIITDSSENYWSNELGWVDDTALADVFTEDEKDTLTLPMGGIWVLLG